MQGGMYVWGREAKVREEMSNHVVPDTYLATSVRGM